MRGIPKPVTPLQAKLNKEEKIKRERSEAEQRQSDIASLESEYTDAMNRGHISYAIVCKSLLRAIHAPGW